MSLPRHILNHSIIWLVLPVVVILAMYVSIGRYFFPLLENYRDDLMLWANDQLAINLQIDQLDGQWNDFDPYIRLDQIQVFAPQIDPASDMKPAIEVRNFSLELDSFSSFRYQFPVVRQASIQGVTLRLTQEEDASWAMNGWNAQESLVSDEQGRSKAESGVRRSRDRIREDVAPITRLLEFLLKQQHLKMEHVWLELTDRYGREYRAYSRRLEVYEVKGQQRLQGVLQLDPNSPQQVAFILEVSGDPFEPSSLKADLYFQADTQSLNTWLEKVAHLLPFDLPELSAGVEAWGSWQGGRLQQLKANLSDASLRLTLPEQPELRLSDFNSTLFWHRKAKGWELIADKLHFLFQDRPFELEQAVARFDSSAWQLQLARLDVKKVSDTLLDWPDLPEKARDALVRLSPTGRLSNLMVSQSDEQGFLLKTELDAVSVEAYYGAPVLRNVSGYVETTAESGFIRFHSDKFFMAYPQLYSDGWWFDRALGEVHWRIGDALRVFGVGLQLNQGKTEVAGEFDLLQPPNDDDLFYLNVGLTQAEEKFGLSLVPDLILSEELTSWLGESVQAASVKQGGFVYDGTLNLSAESPEREVATLLLLDVEQGALKFLPEWPEAKDLDSQIRLDGTELDVRLNSGRYLENDSLKGEITLRGREHSVVGLRLEGSVFPEWGWQVLTDTPLNRMIPESLRHWQLSGQPLKVMTDLSFPLDGGQGKGRVVATAENNQLLIPELAAPLNTIQGQIIYDIDEGLMVEQGRTEFLGGQADFSIKTDLSRGAVIVSGSGQAQTADINQWQPMPFSSWVNGLLSYEFSVDLDKVSYLHLYSDLEGVSVSLPEPVGKTTEDTKALMVEMAFTEGANQFSVSYGGDHSDGSVVSHGLWGGADSAYGVGVWYGRDVKKAQPLKSATQRTDIHISKGQLDAEPWVDFLTEELARQSLVRSVAHSGSVETDMQAGNAKKAEQNLHIHLTTDKLFYGDLALQDLTLDAATKDSGLQAKIAGRQLEGRVAVTPERLDVHLTRLQVSETGKPTSDQNDSRTFKERLDPIFRNAFMETRIQVDELDILGVSGQKLDAEYHSDGASRNVQLRHFYQGGVSFSGALDWVLESESPDSSDQTSLVLTVDGGNLADVQRAFGVPVAISSKNAKASLRLNWKGMPHDVDAVSLSGLVDVDFEKGSFEQVKSVPALKLLSLFNFDSLVRRLQLDFSDLSGKGLSYDRVTGTVVIKDGIGRFEKPLRVASTATRFEMTGRLDFIEEVFDQELVVTLPVGATLPFAAILAGAPQVGGTLYIAQKVFGNLFDKFTQATYTIKGDWDKPQIELKRVF